MVRFLHTADWQLGMRRHFLDDDAQARFSAARVHAVAAMGELAGTLGCEFVVVAGDVFESNHVDRRTVLRTVEALGSVPVPVYLLPGNHDPLDAASIFTSSPFAEVSPEHVHVLTDCEPVVVRPGVEIVGVPWPSKRPARDLVGPVLAALPASPAVHRVAVAHGAVSDGIFATSSTSIPLEAVNAAIAEHRISYLALGDRHSTTSLGPTGRVWYSGAPEPTDFDETDPGNVLVVSLDAGRCEVERHRIASWTFRRFGADVAGLADVDRLAADLAALPAKDRTIVRLGLRGSLGLAAHARLAAVLDDARERFAAIDDWELESDLVVVPDGADLAALDVSGFARVALERLVAGCAADDRSSLIARDALALLHRLVA